MLPGMCLIVLLWLTLGVACCGIGFAVFRVLRVASLPEDALFFAFWTGWAVVLAGLQVWQLFWPVTGVTFWGVILLGFACWVWRRTVFAPRLWMRCPSVCTVAYLLAAAVFGLWLANRGMGPVREFDAGLYHFNVIRWLRTCRLVPGLANLHVRLGFNSAYFLFAALVDSCPWLPSGHHAALTMLLFAGALQALRGVFRILFSCSPVRPSDILIVPFMVPIIEFGLHAAPSTSPDPALFVLGMVTAFTLCTLLLDAPRPARDELLLAGLVIVFCGAGMATKLSHLVFGLVSICVASLAVAVNGRARSVRYGFHCLCLGTVLLAAFLIPLVWRSYMMTGYPLFPVYVGESNVPWAFPAYLGRAFALEVRAWARQPHHVLSSAELMRSWGWLPGWFARMVQERLLVVLPLVLAACGFLLAGVRRRFSARAVLFLLPPLLGLGFWFWAAPDPRFAGAAMWYLGAGALAVAFTDAGDVMSRWFSRCVVTGVALVVLVVHWKTDKFIDPGGAAGYYPIPEPEMIERETRSGLRVFVPARGQRCWNARLPCVQPFRPGLRLRDASRPQSGFVLDYDGTYPRFPGEPWRAAPPAKGDGR